MGILRGKCIVRSVLYVKYLIYWVCIFYHANTAGLFSLMLDIHILLYTYINCLILRMKLNFEKLQIVVESLHSRSKTPCCLSVELHVLLHRCIQYFRHHLGSSSRIPCCYNAQQTFIHLSQYGIDHWAWLYLWNWKHILPYAHVYVIHFCIKLQSVL